MSVKNPLGEKISQLRQSREMSQEELAKGLLALRLINETT
ncbi:hypothetical protein C7960_0061 [Methanohalophilus euhalobius]|jgi:transcriptional regulator with XRE-family HTH domain|uniref:Uncharacterized protein n=1 Tax=Methanohalophilus euhalobius TaxID=51203 RepID=A0A285EMR7_9EURY|nr:MAG: hypothetical protein A8273_1950 [Methanohalophilus sp. 2-GBenrich]TCL10969.1 hypothetical protein C7960_0061 [Methanohalophilus euhalobius]SNX99474.1 hypothetical protein SAMN06295989_10128 [Methanohalophilus euhalobius]